MKRRREIYAVLACSLLLVGSAIAKETSIQCANLIYGGTHTSRCFSDEFLSSVQRQTTIATERRFKSVKLGSDELYKYPFVIMTGESNFHFTRKERQNLAEYLNSGGFLLASAGCSSSEWDRAFRREMRAVFGEVKLAPIAMKHPMFRTVHKIDRLKLYHGGDDPRLEGIEIKNKYAVVYSRHGLNDTSHAEGCCCCGGNEIKNSLHVNVNIFVYALLH